MQKSKFEELRKRIRVYLPQSNQYVTVKEPLAKQRINIMNNLLALQTAGNVDKEEKSLERIKFLYKIIDNYIENCVEEYDQVSQKITLEEKHYLILPIIELLATLTVIEVKEYCSKCNSENNFVLTYDLNLFNDPNIDILEHIKNLREQFEIEKPIYPLIFELPEKTLEPTDININVENLDIRIKVGFPLACINIEDVINAPFTNFEYVHSLYIFETGPQEKIKLMYNATSGNVSVLRDLPESLVKIITRKLNKAIEPYRQERINLKYMFTCQECGNQNEITFEPIQHFFNIFIQ
jgi:hypothetical protein